MSKIWQSQWHLWNIHNLKNPFESVIENYVEFGGLLKSDKKINIYVKHQTHLQSKVSELY